MDEQRLQAYLELIQELLTRPSQVNMLLTAQSDLVDMDLVGVIEGVAEKMLSNGFSREKDFLQYLAAQLTDYLQTPRGSYMQFWIALVKAKVEHNYDTKAIHNLMQDNLVQVDRALGTAMRQWATELLSQRPQEAESIAELLGNICIDIRTFPYGKLVEVSQIALMGYEIVLELYYNNPTQHARFLNNSGIAYRALAKMGIEPIDNLSRALIVYEKAEYLSRNNGVTEQLFIALNNTGNTYLTLSTNIKTATDIEKATNIYKAITYYKEAVKISRGAGSTEELCQALVNLGAAHLSLAQMRIKEIDNLDRAMLIFQESVKISKENGFIMRLLSSIANIGNVYSILAILLNIDPIENLRLAAAQYEEWEDLIKDQENFMRLELSDTFSNAGKIYMSLAEMSVEPIKNFTRAIVSYEKVISIKKNTGSTSVDQEYHFSLSRLSISYLSLARLGVNTIDNLYLSIHNLEEAVKIFRSANLTEELAISLQGIGVVYLALFDQNIDPINCCHKAINFIEESIEIDKNRTEDGSNFGILGIAYRHLATMGIETVETMNKSIASYMEAARINRLNNLTTDLAITLNNMGIAYATLGEMKINSVDNFTNAIAIYEEALVIYRNEALVNDTSTLLMNMGNVYLDLAEIDVNRVENLEKAMLAYKEAEEICKSSDLLTCELFRIIHKKGNVYLALAEMGEEADSNYNHAINHYCEALIFFTSKNLPSDSLRTGRVLGNIGIKLGNWDIAIEGYSLAIEAIEQSRAWSREESHREEVQSKAIEVYTNIVQALIQLHRYPEALQYAERSRSKRLSDLMRVNDFYQKGEIPTEIKAKLEAYDALQRQIDAIYHKLDGNSQTLTLDTLRPSISAIEKQRVTALEAQQTTLWQELRRQDPIAAAGKRIIPLEIAEIGQLLGNDNHTALLSFFSTPTDTFIFIACRDSKQQLQIAVHHCPDQGIRTLHDAIMEQWIKPYSADDNYSEWSKQITPFLQECSDRLAIDTLITQHLDDTITDLILIPHLYLHQIPFAALPLTPIPQNEASSQNPLLGGVPVGRGGSSAGCLGDRFTIRYAPSCEILKICDDRPDLDTRLNYGIIEGASLDVPYGIFQGEEIATLLNIPPAQRLCGTTEATIDNFKQLAQTVNILHSYHHATSNPNEPLKSSLALADGNITLAQLLVWQLTGLQEVFLSCCETAFGISQTSTDEIFTLASGFLCAGARTVIATLWSVDQLSAALMCIFYYEHRERGLDRPHALQAAQQQLRQLSGTTLDNVYGERLEACLKINKEQLSRAHDVELTKGDEAAKASFKRLQKVEDMTQNLKYLCGQDRPFADPVYWAAFTCQGLP